MQVISPRGRNYHHTDKVESGNFAFTAPETGDYMTCFWASNNNPPKNVSIEFEWKTGIDVSEWYNVARKGQIDVSFSFFSLTHIACVYLAPKSMLIHAPKNMLLCVLSFG